MRRSLAHGEKCILACDKTLTGGTVAVQDGRLRFTASAPRQISYRIPLFSAIKYSIIAKKYPHGAISGECAAPFG